MTKAAQTQKKTIIITHHNTCHRIGEIRWIGWEGRPEEESGEEKVEGRTSGEVRDISGETKVEGLGAVRQVCGKVRSGEEKEVDPKEEDRERHPWLTTEVELIKEKVRAAREVNVTRAAKQDTELGIVRKGRGAEDKKEKEKEKMTHGSGGLGATAMFVGSGGTPRNIARGGRD